MHFQWHWINGSLTFIPKAASEIATSLENDHKEAGTEKLKTGESEVQKQLSNGKSASKLSPKHIPGRIQPDSETLQGAAPRQSCRAGNPWEAPAAESRPSHS